MDSKEVIKVQPMNPEIKKKWVEALVSGKYKQGKHFLRNDKNEYCCLGVLTHLYEEETGNKCNYTQPIISGNVAKWAGLVYDLNEHRYCGVCFTKSDKEENSDCLMNLNDNDVPFTEIARVIEEYF